ncbi:MAG: carboxypeptidase regulatory-like domain-containing protein, partial [Blastocatellia bacterium]|nr:carboxypeptidase regulatory-like domain-containing protein [Blastocatellia bacterium]
MKIIVACFLVLFATSDYYSQTTSRITGTIHDQAGVALAGATVTAKNLETNSSRTSVSDAEGRYTFPELRVGRYEIRAEKLGFKPAVTTGINLTVAETAVINLSLELVIQESVEVAGQATQVNTTSAELSYLVGERTIRELPLNGRNYTDLALLQPGV